MRLKVARSMRTVESFEDAVTVAARGASLRSASSPKNAPEPSVGQTETSAPEMDWVHSAVPVSMM